MFTRSLEAGEFMNEANSDKVKFVVAIVQAGKNLSAGEMLEYMQKMGPRCCPPPLNTHTHTHTVHSQVILLMWMFWIKILELWDSECEQKFVRRVFFAWSGVNYSCTKRSLSLGRQPNIEGWHYWLLLCGGKARLKMEKCPGCLQIYSARLVNTKPSREMGVHWKTGLRRSWLWPGFVAFPQFTMVGDQREVDNTRRIHGWLNGFGVENTSRHNIWFLRLTFTAHCSPGLHGDQPGPTS